MTFVGLITGVIGQRQHFTRDGVKHDHTACLGLVAQDGIAQFLIGHKLHLAVQAELNVFAVHRRDLLAYVFNHPPQPVLDDAARACTTRQFFVEPELNTILATVFNVGKAHHMGGSRAFWVLSFVFFALVDTLDPQSADFLGHRVIDLPPDPDKALVFVGQFFSQLCQWHV